jgi:hypothetical protein
LEHRLAVGVLSGFFNPLKPGQRSTCPLGAQGTALCSESFARASVVFFNGIWKRLRRFFVSLLMTPDTIAERRYANQFCRRDDWMIE